MDLGLKGRKALVTRSTGGIGLATAIGLAREGAHVFVNGRTVERVERARNEVLRVVRRPAAGSRLRAGPGLRQAPYRAFVAPLSRHS